MNRLDLPSPTGPAVARLFHGLLAGVFLVAWASLGSQVQVLIGADGLAPVAPALAAARSRGADWLAAPTHLWLNASDAALAGSCWLGAAFALSALLGLRVRLCLAATTLLYLGMCIGAGTFLAFQWDSLLIECGLLAALLPRDRPAPVAHALLRVLLWKVFFESAVAKAGSALGDWWDGSAMTFYYETAPIPTRLAWFAHHAPAAWHAFEGYWTLFFEGVLSFGVFGPRRLRQLSLAAFLSFLVVDTATANYGFFTHLTAALCVFLLDEHTVAAAGRRLGRLLPAAPPLAPAPGPVKRAFFGLFAAGWLALSAAGALAHFTDHAPLAGAVEVASRLRAANVYHLFTQITRDRVEPEFQTFDGTDWTAQHLRYKPGPLDRAPPFVAPHQPRVDFRLWFYGLSWRRGAPSFVGELLERLCHAPAAVQPLFAAPLPATPTAVRIQFWRYTFTSAAQRAATGDWWQRSLEGETAEVDCAAI